MNVAIGVGLYLLAVRTLCVLAGMTRICEERCGLAVGLGAIAQD